MLLATPVLVEPIGDSPVLGGDVIRIGNSDVLAKGFK
jgi:hypothetical protein